MERLALDATMNDDAPHSALYFNDSISHWWNDDFLALMATRVGLASCRTLLDVGCGVGHWHRSLAPFLAAPFAITAADREPRWVDECARNTRHFIEHHRLHGTVVTAPADAHALPFDDNSFDIVTCQTVLIHLRDPALAVREMVRVLKPGGSLLLAEPNNHAVITEAAALGPDTDLDLLLHALRFQHLCLRGKHALGLGFNSLGAMLPGLLDSRALTDITFAQSDKAHGLFAPYDSAEQRDEIATLRDFLARGIHGWPRDEARRYFIAGGGDSAGFDALYQQGLAYDAAILKRIDEGSLSTLIGMSMNLGWAKKHTLDQTPQAVL